MRGLYPYVKNTPFKDPVNPLFYALFGSSYFNSKNRFCRQEARTLNYYKLLSEKIEVLHFSCEVPPTDRHGALEALLDLSNDPAAPSFLKVLVVIPMDYPFVFPLLTFAEPAPAWLAPYVGKRLKLSILYEFSYASVEDTLRSLRCDLSNGPDSEFAKSLPFTV
jgi:hypothetical protein